jgi:hypothetical protein
MYIALHVKYPLSLSDFNEIELSRQIFEINQNIKSHKNPSSGSGVGPCGQADMRALIVCFRNFAKSSKCGERCLRCLMMQTVRYQHDSPAK